MDQSAAPWTAVKASKRITALGVDDDSNWQPAPIAQEPVFSLPGWLHPLTKTQLHPQSGGVRRSPRFRSEIVVDLQAVGFE